MKSPPFFNFTRREFGSLMVAGAAIVASQVPLRAWAAEDAIAEDYQETVAKGIDYLRVKGQAEDGSFSSFAGIGPSALATTALLRHGRTSADPAVAKALKFLEGNIRPDGGIYSKNSRFQNYETCVSILAFTEANKDGKYDKAIADANKFLRKIQADASAELESSDVNYGGGGYGPKSRPDLSNTAFLMDALVAAGAKSNDEALQKALLFVSRCQNLETEDNTTPLAAKNPDGGFYYTPASGGQSASGRTEEGGLQSYGTMTYAGLKSMIYAGVKPDDPRVKAAVKWIEKHYNIKENPNMGSAGLFYYYHTFAKALDVMGLKEVVDADGKMHDWRVELIEELSARQRPDGSWVNQNNKWLEGDANLVTAFALLALSHAKPE